MRITFCGAAQTVTGSQHLVEVDGHRILLDCGLYQGRRDEANKRNRHFHYDPKRLDCVILSHAHIDHAGNLPTLVAAGYRGPIYCTSATADVATIMLRDSAHIQFEDAEFLNRHERRRGEPHVQPLYGLEDVERTEQLLKPTRYFEPFQPLRGVETTFWDAGHVLGSAIVQLDLAGTANSTNSATRLVFTGDLGRSKLPILRDPMTVRDVNVLISESTYGGRVHNEVSNVKDRLAQVLTEVVERHGKVVIPAFSFGRTQNVVYYMNELFAAGRLPRLPIYVDSPLSVGITDVYRKHTECYDADTARVLVNDPDVFGFFGLTYIRLATESRKLNKQDGPFVVIASSGMCEAGRVLHHLRHTVADPNNVILIVGYQAPHTLGRRIAERTPKLRIMHDWFDLRAQVHIFDELSSHADRNDFQRWYEATGGGMEHAFLVHGEPDSMSALVPVLQPFVKNSVRMPAMYEAVEV